MGHRVSGIVAQAQALAGIAADRGLGRPIPLAHGLAPLPIDEENVGGLAGYTPEATPPASLLSFEYLTPPSWRRRPSRRPAAASPPSRRTITAARAAKGPWSAIGAA